MPKGRLEYLKRLLPFLQNQSEDCLYLNIFAPVHGEFNGFNDNDKYIYIQIYIYTRRVLYEPKVFNLKKIFFLKKNISFKLYNI